MPLVTIEDDRHFRLEVRLDESRAAFVHLGDDVRVRFDGGGQTPRAGSPRWSACLMPARTTSS